MMKITLFLFQSTKVPFFQWKQCIKRNVQLLVPPFFPNFLLGMSMTAVKPVKQQTILSTTRKEKKLVFQVGASKKFRSGKRDISEYIVHWS